MPGRRDVCLISITNYIYYIFFLIIGTLGLDLRQQHQSHDDIVNLGSILHQRLKAMMEILISITKIPVTRIYYIHHAKKIYMCVLKAFITVD